MRKDGRNKRNSIKHILMTLLFCIVMSIGTVCLAAEGTVNRDAVIRKTADPNSEKIGSATQGKKIDIVGWTTGTDGKKWYQVYKDSNTKGYIRSDLITVPENVTIPQLSQTTASNTSTESGTVTATEPRRAMIKVDSTNIRTTASASSAKKATVNKGTVVTVTGETTGTDGKKWYQVSQANNNEEIVGFVRNDLITFDNVPPEEETSQITGNTNNEEDPQDPPVDDIPEQTDPTPDVPVPAAVTGTDNKSNVVLMNTEEDPPYIMAGFKEKTMDWIDGQKYKIYLNGKFFICYGRKQNGEEGWLLYDIDQDMFQRYAYSAEDATIPGASVGLIPVIILVAIIIILLAVIGILALKLRDYKDEDDEDEEDEDEEEDEYGDDIEDIEEDEDDEDERPRPVRRQQPSRQNGGAQRQPVQQQPVMRRTQSGTQRTSTQGVRRAQPGSQSNPQGIRRTQTGAPQTSQQGARRVQTGAVPPGSQQTSPQGVRRQPSAGGEGSRPQGTRPSNGQQVSAQAQGRQGSVNERQPSPQGTRRSQYQNVSEQPQRGYKTKNTLENEEDDMDFMDI